MVQQLLNYGRVQYIMRKHTLRVTLIVLAVFGGLSAIAVALVRHVFGPGYVVVVLHNAGSTRTELVSIVQLGEAGRYVVGESHQVRVGAGDTTEVHLVPEGDVVLWILLSEAGGAERQFIVKEDLSRALGKTLLIEVADGHVTRVRVRGNRDDSYREATWAPG